MGIINYLGSQLIGLGNRLYGFSSSAGIQVGVDGRGFFIPVGSSNNVLTLMDYKDFDSAYFQCSTLQTVIVNKGQCKVNATWDLYKGDSKKPSTNPRANDIRAKMKKPNCLQTYAQFRMDVSIYVAIHGFCIIWFVPNGSSFGTGYQNIWALNPADLVITYKQGGKYVFQNDLKDIIESIKLNYSGGQIDVPINEIEFVKDQVATKSSNGMQPPIVPTSRMFGLKMVVSNNLASYDSRNSMVVNRGAQGFIVNQTKDSASFIPLLENEKLELQREMNAYGIMRGQSKVPMTSKDLKYVSTAMSTRELMIFEESEETMCRIVDVYGYPIDLLATSKTGNIGDHKQSVQEARKNLYQNTIIPEDLNEMPAIFAHFDLENDGLQVKTSYKHIEELSEDEQKEEELITARIDNIAKINAMPVSYEVKINIASEQFEISNEDAKKIISENDSSRENTTVQKGS